MSRASLKAVGRLLMLAAPLSALAVSCISPQPSPEAVLEGTWVVTVENVPDLQQLELTFGASGILTTVTYQVANNAVIVVPSPAGSGSVSGDDVIITATFRGNGLEFQGTLNEANTIITGSLTTHIVLNSVVIVIDNGPATLTKQ